MNNSMISAMVSMNSMQQRLDLIADNIANLNTVGYKGKDSSFEDVLTAVQQHNKDFAMAGRATQPGYTLGFGARLASVTRNMDQGQLKETGNPLDLAVEGQAMFAVQSGGNTAYTREGGFHVSPDPEDAGFVHLVNNQGYVVLDEQNQPIRLPSSGKVAVDAEGQIWLENADGVRTAQQRLKLVDLERPEALVQMDGNLFTLAAGLAEADVFSQESQSSVRSGYLEQSNVDIAEEMTKMMEVQRAYQLAARALSSSDSMMNLANTIRG